MSLLTSLICYWKLDEASGNGLDSHGTDPLTDNNTVGSASGKIGNARDFEASSSEWLQRADRASLSTGDIDFTIAGWVNAESFTANDGYIASKMNAALANPEYRLFYNGTTSRFQFELYGAGVSRGAAVANTLGAPSTATWYYIVAWHDSVANTVNIQVNDGGVDSTGTSGGGQDTASVFCLGSRAGDANTFWDGLLDEWAYWERTLTSGERTSLYNGGAGLAYPLTVAGGAARQMDHYRRLRAA